MASSTIQALGARYPEAQPDCGSISPLPPSLQGGLISLSVFSLLSLAFASAALLYVAARLIAWYSNKNARAKALANSIPDLVPDFTFRNYTSGPLPQSSSKEAHDRSVQEVERVRNDPPNQFLVLLLNLFLADIHQAVAFVPSLVWLQKHGIFIKTAPWIIQRFFDSVGDSSSSLFITTIVIYTYCSVVRGYRPPQKLLYTIIGAIWLVVYGMSVIPLLVSQNGEGTGSHAAHAESSCQTYDAYEPLRIITHYTFVFLSFMTACGLCIAILYFQRLQTAEDGSTRLVDQDPTINIGHNSAFLLYPVIYITCILPMAIGRIASLTGHTVSTKYYCFSGAMVASKGVFDCIPLFAVRRSMVLGSSQELKNASSDIETTAVASTANKQFGNEVRIVAGTMDQFSKVNGSGSTKGHGRSMSEETFTSTRSQLTIQLDVITSIEFEDCDENDIRFSGPCFADAPSLDDWDEYELRLPEGI